MTKKYEKLSKKKLGFTLPEVLITLGIIGIVAAITIPTLVQNYKKKIVETRLLKVYSMMNQAIKLSSVDNGPLETWDKLGAYGTSTATYNDIYNWFNKYLAPYIKVQKLEKHPESENLIVYFLDGSALQIEHYIYDCYYSPFAKDIKNGTIGTKKFVFRLATVNASNSSEVLKYTSPHSFEPYAFSWDGTIEGAKYSTIVSEFGCYENEHLLCTKLIQLNGWKIPDDYPYKF